MERRRRARAGAGARRRRLRPRRAGADEHRHRPARARVPRRLRELTRRSGTLLIIDETHTFSAGPGGCTAAWGLEPDLLTIGKAIGGGVPAGAYGVTRRRRGADRGARGCRLRGRRRDRRDARRQRAVAGGRARDADGGADRRGVRADDPARGALRRRRRGRDRGRRAALARDRARRARRVPLLGDATAERGRVGRRRRRGAGALPAPLRAQPRRADDAVPQHGADVAGDERGRRRPAHEVFTEAVRDVLG